MKLRLIFLAFFFTALNINCYSCECVEKPLEKEIANTNSIFIGKVIKIDSINADIKNTTQTFQKTTFEVSEIYKGDDSKQITVFTKTTRFMCDVYFFQDSTYLVFANETTINNAFNNKVLSTHSCTRTGLAIWKPDLISKLRSAENIIDEIQTISAEELYGDIWKNEVFSDPDRPAELMLTPQEELTIIKNNLESCPIDSVFPSNRADKFIYEMGDWNFKPTVHVLFDISNRGELSNFRIQDDRGLPDQCLENAIKFVEYLKPWKPASIKGINVNSEGRYVVDFSKVEGR